MPLRALRSAKENLLMNFRSISKEELNEYIDFYNTLSNQSAETKELRKEIFQGLNYQEINLPDEYAILTTLWAICIHDILFSGDDISIAVLCYSVKGEKEFDFVPFSRRKFFEMPQFFSEVLQYPHIHVPLNPIVKEFLGNTENLDTLISMQFLTPDEIKVIKAIRSGRLKELIIHFSEGKSPMRIEAIESGHVSKDVLSRLIRILGTKDYKEFSLKVRNDKTLYYENRIKIL